MGESASDSEESDTVSYYFEADRERWREWVETIPRREPIDSRLRTLIDQDLRAARRDANGGLEGKSVTVFASRIRIRAIQARGGLDDDDPDIDGAIEQLDELIEMANLLEG